MDRMKGEWAMPSVISFVIPPNAAAAKPTIIMHENMRAFQCQRRERFIRINHNHFVNKWRISYTIIIRMNEEAKKKCAQRMIFRSECGVSVWRARVPVFAILLIYGQTISVYSINLAYVGEWHEWVLNVYNGMWISAVYEGKVIGICSFGTRGKPLRLSSCWRRENGNEQTHYDQISVVFFFFHLLVCLKNFCLFFCLLFDLIELPWLFLFANSKKMRHAAEEHAVKIQLPMSR